MNSSLTRVAFSAVNAGYRSVEQFHALSVVRTRAWLAVVRGSGQRITVESRGTALTVQPICVVLAYATPYIQKAHYGHISKGKSTTTGHLH